MPIPNQQKKPFWVERADQDNPLLALLLKNAAAAEIKKDPFCPVDYEPADRVIEAAMEHTGLTGGTCPACLAMRATRHMATDFNFIHEPECAGLVGGWVMVTDPEPKTETVTINGLPYHRLVATDTPSEGMAGKADEVMKGILDGTLSRPKVKQIGDAVAERTKKDSGGDALGGAIGRSIRHGSFMERRTPYSD